MSLPRDVERGDEAEDSLAPLLSPSSGLERLRPARPRLTPYGNFDEDPAFMNQLGPSSEISTPDITPLGDTEDIFPRKWRRSDRRLRRLNTELLEAINDHDIEEVEKLLKNGANPNATCRLDLVSACHMSALSGGDALGLLIKFGAEKYRLDRLGRTPLHLAAFAGNSRQVAILLDFPEDMQKRVDSDDLSSEAEEEVKKLCPITKELVNIRCNLGNVENILPKNWKDNIDHNCLDIKGTLPILQPGFTPLHVAASCARAHCVRLLLAAGADPNICDAMGRTALDVAGSGYYYGHGIATKCFTEVIRILINAGGKFYTMKARGQNIETPLHTAVLMENIESIEDLLNAGVSIACLDSSGQTPLHLCVKNELEEPLQILANYAYKDADPMSAMVDVKDYEGHTVLQASVEASWVPGVCIALEAGADVAMREILYMNVKSLEYLLQLETWIKFSSIALAAILPPTVAIALGSESEWPRHVATCALLLSWIELMFLLSRFPNWGYYVLMFGKVASNVIKILLTFGFLVVGFSLSFMIQFRSETPFDGPWAAMVKTMVMMTSEFDYGALFDEEHSKELATSLIVVRLIFLIFLILAAIVLMNLMVGVAVNDINDLEVLGNIRRLAKQVEFLSILDNLVYNTFFSVVLPRKIIAGIKNKKNVCETMLLCPGRPRWRYYKTIPSRIRNAILDKVQKQNKQIEEEHRFEAFSKLMQEIHEALTTKDTRTEKIETAKGEKLEQKKKYDEVMNRLNSLDECVRKVEDKVMSYVHESNTPIEQLHVKVDQLSLEIEEIKSFLTRLEKKLSLEAV